MNQNWDKPNANDKESKSSLPGKQPGCSALLIILLIIFAFSPFLISYFGVESEEQSQISYTSFRGEIEKGNVESVTVIGDQITGELLQAATVNLKDGSTHEYTNFVTYFPIFGDEQLFALLQQNNVDVMTEPVQTFTWWTVLLSALPFLLLVALALSFLRRTQKQGENMFSMGKSRARLYNNNREHTTFSDVAGAEGTKREQSEVVDFLRNPGRYKRLGGEIPRGVLLVGPPGTGKTLLARAVAGEASAPFFSITGSDFMEMFVGVGASRVRNLFQEAKRNSSAIIFIDELDSIGRRRGAGVGGGHDEREQTLNQLLSEMDGFEPNENVIVIAATNRPDILDPALLRPGRFDRRVTVDLPTLKDRTTILEIHARNKPLSDDVQLETIARGTPGFSGADLANLLNEAALTAARSYKNEIDNEDIHQATDKILLGLERENLGLTEKECRLLAYHEAGHAVVAAVLPNTDPVHKVTIVPRSRSMGVTQQIPERDRYLYPKEYMLDRVAVMMGGRVAEEYFMDTMTSGAENDLKQATQLVRKMVLDWGMSKKLGPIALGDERDEVFLGEELGHRRIYSELTAREIDEEIIAILEDAYQRAKEALKANQEGLDRLVKALLDHEIVRGDEVHSLLGIKHPKKTEKRREKVIL
jgi:cell division protease FtsH